MREEGGPELLASGDVCQLHRSDPTVSRIYCRKSRRPIVGYGGIWLALAPCQIDETNPRHREVAVRALLIAVADMTRLLQALTGEARTGTGRVPDEAIQQ
jgi:hypothetical protein